MYKINEQLVKALLNYLGTRPYAEVHEAIRALQSLEVVDDKKSKS